MYALIVTYQYVLLVSPMLFHTKLTSKMAVGINNIHCDFNIILKLHLDKFMNLIGTQKVYRIVEGCGHETNSYTVTVYKENEHYFIEKEDS